jgi:hypothetical protein
MTAPTLDQLLADWHLGDDSIGRNATRALTAAGITPTAAAVMTPRELAAIPDLGTARLQRVHGQLWLILRALLAEREQLRQAAADVDRKFRLGHRSAWCATCRLPKREGTPVVKTLTVVCEDCAADLAATAGRLDPTRLAERRADRTAALDDGQPAPCVYFDQPGHTADQRPDPIGPTRGMDERPMCPPCAALAKPDAEDDGSYSDSSGESATSWHTIRLYHGEHLIDPGLHNLVDVTHADSCRTLPIGARCWYDVDPIRHWWPTIFGTYRIRLTSHINGGSEDGPNIELGMDIQALDDATGAWSDWDNPRPLVGIGGDDA